MQRAHRTQRSRSSSTWRGDVDRLGEGALDVLEPGLRARPLRHRLVLQRALAALVADRAVQRVVDQQQLHDAVLRLVGHRRRVLGLDLHARRVTSIVQEACGLGIGRRLPSGPGVATSTRHWRQAPTGSSSGWSQNRGIWMPTCSAARMTRVPLGTLMLDAVDGQGDQLDVRRDLRVAALVDGVATRGGAGGDGHADTGLRSRRTAWTPPAGTARRPAVCVPASNSSRKYCTARRDRAGRTVTEGAERPAQDVVADVEQLVDVVLGALAVLEPLQDLLQPVGALAARACTCRRTRARRSRSSAYGRAHHAGGLVEDLQRAGAEHRARPRATDSKSSGTSRCSAVKIGVEEPPGVQNFSFVAARACRRPCRAARAA